MSLAAVVGALGLLVGICGTLITLTVKMVKWQTNTEGTFTANTRRIQMLEERYNEVSRQIIAHEKECAEKHGESVTKLNDIDEKVNRILDRK